MKRFTIPCNFGGQKAPFTIYVGSPEPQHHPLHFQAEWLAKVRGGTIPGDVMDNIAKLFELSKRNNVSFEELCVYAINNTENREFGGDDIEPPSPDEPAQPS